MTLRRRQSRVRPPLCGLRSLKASLCARARLLSSCADVPDCPSRPQRAPGTAGRPLLGPKQRSAQAPCQVCFKPSAERKWLHRERGGRNGLLRASDPASNLTASYHASPRAQTGRKTQTTTSASAAAAAATSSSVTSAIALTTCSASTRRWMRRPRASGRALPTVQAEPAARRRRSCWSWSATNTMNAG